MTRADDLVTQQKSYSEVYEAMARSLGEAWKELNVQLEGRRNLLNQALRYHTITGRVSGGRGRGDIDLTNVDLSFLII